MCGASLFSTVRSMFGRVEISMWILRAPGSSARDGDTSECISVPEPGLGDREREIGGGRGNIFERRG